MPVTNKEEILAEEHFVNTQLSNRIVVHAILLNLERRLKKNESSYQDYDMFLQEYLTLGHMKLSIHPSNYLLPHHPVYKTSSSGTKIRVVFNGFAGTRSGKFLNELLLSGSKLQKPLPGLLIKFRRHVVALSADIHMVHKQILLSPSVRPC